MSKNGMSKSQKRLLRTLPKPVACYLVKLFGVEELATLFESRQQLRVLHEQALMYMEI